MGITHSSNKETPEKKNHGHPRFVVDYRALTQITKGVAYPVPAVSNVLYAVSSGKVFSKFDLASGLWQVKLREKDRHKSAFTTHLGLYEFLRLPFGLKTSGNAFQRILNTVFAKYHYQWLIIYVDDLIL